MAPVETPSTRRYYRPELDILRFCCFLLVFTSHSISRNKGIFHNAVVDACGFGVPVFFLLSSFLITHMLLVERERSSTVHLGAFYARRILRIWPLYYGVFGLCWILQKLHFLVAIPFGMTLCFLFLSGNWFISLIGLPGNPASVLWSVSVEEQYYLVWPLLIRAGGKRVLRIVSYLVIPISYLSLAFLAWHGTNPDLGIWSNTFAQMQFFAFGSLLAIYFGDRPLKLTSSKRLLLLMVVALSWIASSLCRVKRPDDLNITVTHACLGYAFMAIGAICLFLVFYGLPVRPTRWTNSLTYLGKISYGLYAYHSLMIVIADRYLTYAGSHLQARLTIAITSFVMTVGVAAASYRWFESPFLKLKEKFTFVFSRAV